MSMINKLMMFIINYMIVLFSILMLKIMALNSMKMKEKKDTQSTVLYIIELQDLILLGIKKTSKKIFNLKKQLKL